MDRNIGLERYEFYNVDIIKKNTIVRTRKSITIRVFQMDQSINRYTDIRDKFFSLLYSQ